MNTWFVIFVSIENQKVISIPGHITATWPVLTCRHDHTQAFLSILSSIILSFLLYTSVCAALEADGSSDEIDVPLRKLFADRDLVNRYGLMSLNSVNWSRILVQLAHFIYAYLQLSGVQDTDGDTLPTVEVVVPTGGAGNITGTDSPTGIKPLLPLWCLWSQISYEEANQGQHVLLGYHYMVTNPEIN